MSSRQATTPDDLKNLPLTCNGINFTMRYKYFSQMIYLNQMPLLFQMSILNGIYYSSTDFTRPAKERIMKTGKNIATSSDIRFPRLNLLVVVHHCEHI
jgi:hypothetical protein